MTVNRILLAHAKVLEDVSQYFVGGDLAACDFGESVKCLAEVFTEKVAAKLYLEAIDDTLDAIVSTNQSIVMTSICHDDIVLCQGWDVGRLVDGLL